MATNPAALPAQFTADSDAILNSLPPLWQALVIKQLQGGYPYAVYSPMTGVLNSLGAYYAKALAEGKISANPEVVREANPHPSFDEVGYIAKAVTAYYLNALATDYRQFAAYMAAHGLNAMGVGDFFALAVGAFIGVSAATGLGAAAASSAAGAGAGAGSGVVPISTTLTGVGLPAAGAGTAAAVGAGVSAAGGLATTLGHAVTSLTGSSTLGSIVSTIGSSLGSVLSEIETILKPITTYTENILKTVDTLNKSFIEPLSTMINKDYTLVTGTIGEIQSLAHAGIQGILEIPTALNSAFSQLNLAQKELAKLTGAENTTIVDQHLVPGLQKSVGDPIANLHSLLAGYVNSPVEGVATFAPVRLPKEPVGENLPSQSVSYTDQWNTVGGWVDNATATVGADIKDALSKLPGAASNLGQAIMAIAAPLLTLLATEGPAQLLARNNANLNRSYEPLEVGQAIRAVFRGILTQSQAQIEAGYSGLSRERLQVMIENEMWLPSPEAALRLLYRKAIDQSTFDSICAKQGLTVADRQALQEAFLEPVNPREAIIANGRFAAAQAGFLKESYGSAPPPEYTALYDPRFANPAIARFDWMEHWKTPPLSWFMTAYFRGLVTKDEVYQAAQAENIPGELVDKLIPVEQEIIQLWMIPDMIASGTFSEQEAVSYLEYMGIDARSAKIITKYGLSKAKGPAAGQAAALAGLSASQARSMFEDGIIDAAAYEEVLIEHGYSAGAAALTVKLYTQQINLTQRKQFAGGLIKQYAAGYITLTQLQQQLYSASFNTSEVAGYVIEAKGKVLDKAKSLTEAQVKAFWEKGILSTEASYEALQIYGYAPAIAAAFIELWTGKPYEPGTSPTTLATA